MQSDFFDFKWKYTSGAQFPLFDVSLLTSLILQSTWARTWEVKINLGAPGSKADHGLSRS